MPNGSWSGSSSGRPSGAADRVWSTREVMTAIFYVLSTGCQWNAIPSDLPPPQLRLGLPRSSGVGRHHRPPSRRALRREPRRAGRDASQTSAILDAQSARGAVKGGARAWSVRLRCREEGPRPQAPRPRLHAGRSAPGPWPAKQVRLASGGMLLNVDVHFADIQSLPLGLTRRTATVPKLCVGRRGDVSHSSSASSPMAAMPDPRCERSLPAPAVGSLRS